MMKKTLLVLLLGGCAAKASTYEPQDPRGVGVAVPFVELGSADEVEGALAALAGAGLDVGDYDATRFGADSMGIVVGVPELRRSEDGTFEVVRGPVTWAWQEHSSLSELSLAVVSTRWDWSRDGVGVLVVGPWVESYVTIPCNAKRSKVTVPEGVYYDAVPVPMLPDVQPTLYLLPIANEVEVVHAIRREHVVADQRDCFMQ